MSVPVPSLKEQQEILDFIDVRQGPLLVGISRLEREITLIREYRTRLVADVVTGKLDVREVAARLPEEVLPDSDSDLPDLTEDSDPPDEEAAV